MADIRIKDLTTTASSTASDDFIAVDGATNGTRKLNAYSPSFGGNATVAGTLTVNGGSGIVTQGGGSDTTLQVTQTGTAGAYCLLKSTAAPSAAFGGYSFEDAGSVRWFIGGQGGYANSAHDFNVTVNGAYRFRIDTAGVSRVLSTTASTSTSTGALVVSGGVGVAGAINAGGNATVFGTAGITINNINGLGNDSILTLTQSGVSNAFIKNTATTGDIAIGDGGGTYLRITKGVGVVSLLNTSASTSTSTGALVVSGGVGVAGAINVGNPVIAQGTTVTGYQFLAKDTGGTAVGAAYALQTSGGTDKWRWGLRGSAGALTDSLIFSALDGSWLDALTISNSGNATLGGSIRTSAPAGGTAAAWKLGTVASVSPTSPNRTIEVDIGGTIYYIHAKTTNN